MMTIGPALKRRQISGETTSTRAHGCMSGVYVKLRLRVRLSYCNHRKKQKITDESSNLTPEVQVRYGGTSLYIGAIDGMKIQVEKRIGIFDRCSGTQ